MKITKYIFYTAIPLLSIFSLLSCDKDFNEVGSDLVNNNHFGVLSETYPVIAYNQKISAIESNNLPINPLGIYDNPAFGTTTASFVTQLDLASNAYAVGTNPVIESVELRIPYYTTLKTTNTDGSHVYELDSIYGAANGKIKLSVYESGYFIRDLDPNDNFLSTQKFYTDEKAVIENKLIGSRLNNDVEPTQNDSFFFSNAEFVEITKDSEGKETKNYTAPQMRLKLDKTYFQTKILSQNGISKLASKELFKDYFRGLFFKVERSGVNEPAMAMLNFSLGSVVIKYKEDATKVGDARVEKTITLNLAGNRISFPEVSNENVDYLNATTNPSTSGDAKLYLKGGAGSMAIIDLFAAGEIAQIKAKGWLINEANLVFNIDTDAMADAKTSEPNRIFLYDLNNRRTLIDYALDQTTTTSNAKKNKIIFGGYINNSTTGTKKGLTYKIRITNHIRNLIKKDSTNVKLGLVVTENIALTTQNSWRNPFSVAISPTKSVNAKTPQASVMNPLGTILYGSNPAVPADKRLKLEIIYTKPE